MRRALTLALVLAAAAFAARAQDDDPQALTQEFISPMGEPFRAHRNEPYPVDAWFKQADTDGDGALSKAEFQADALRFFKRLDKDGDGYLDDHEVDAYENEIAPEIKAAMGPDPNAVHARTPTYEDYRGPNGEAPTTYASEASRINDSRARDADKRERDAQLSRRRGAGVFSFFDEPEPVRAADTNIDFRISLTEWMAAADRRFKELDLNHDGKLERSELPMTPFQRAILKRK
jgi:hypothetical protein